MGLQSHLSTALILYHINFGQGINSPFFQFSKQIWFPHAFPTSKWRRWHRGHGTTKRRRWRGRCPKPGGGGSKGATRADATEGGRPLRPLRPLRRLGLDEAWSKRLGAMTLVEMTFQKNGSRWLCLQRWFPARAAHCTSCKSSDTSCALGRHTLPSSCRSHSSEKIQKSWIHLARQTWQTWSIGTSFIQVALCPDCAAGKFWSCGLCMPGRSNLLGLMDNSDSLDPFLSNHQGLFNDKRSNINSHVTSYHQQWLMNWWIDGSCFWVTLRSPSKKHLAPKFSRQHCLEVVTACFTSMAPAGAVAGAAGADPKRPPRNKKRSEESWWLIDYTSDSDWLSLKLQSAWISLDGLIDLDWLQSSSWLQLGLIGWEDHGLQSLLPYLQSCLKLHQGSLKRGCFRQTDHLRPQGREILDVRPGGSRQFAGPFQVLQ